MKHFPSNGDWRDLARQIEQEKDPHKMVALAEQLVEKLDEVLRLSPDPAANVEQE